MCLNIYVCHGLNISWFLPNFNQMKFMLLTQCPRVFVRMSSDFLIPPGKKSTIFFAKKNIVFGLCTCSQLKYYVWTEKKNMHSVCNSHPKFFVVSCMQAFCNRCSWTSVYSLQDHSVPVDDTLLLYHFWLRLLQLSIAARLPQLSRELHKKPRLR